MVIAFGNIKGGTGKSTLLLLLASYLARAEKKKVFIIEMQETGALGLLFNKSKLLEHELPFEYFSCDLSRFGLLSSRLKLETDCDILIELSTSIHDERILSVFGCFDILICPFCYDSPTVNSTIYFANLARRIRPGLAILFLPNRIIPTAFYEFRAEIDQVLRQMAPVSTAISEHIGFQRISSMNLPQELILRCEATLELIFYQYISPLRDNNNSQN